MKNKKTLTRAEHNKRNVIITVSVLVGLLVLCAVMIAIINSISGGDGEFDTMPSIDPMKLYDTYPEDFDIMEYDEYLGFDRNIYLYDSKSGVTQTISAEDARMLGKGVELLYNVIGSIINGDFNEYNSYMGDAKLKKEGFTQQQLYDIKISEESRTGDGGKVYDEYIFKVTYRIHENNGTYRDTIESDVSRAEYFYVNNSTGEYKVAKIVEHGAGRK